MHQELKKLSCSLLEAGSCKETQKSPTLDFVRKFCSKDQGFTKCAFYNLWKWKTGDNLDLRRIESDEYSGLKKLDSLAVLHGVIRYMIRTLTTCPRCSEVKHAKGREKYCDTHRFYIQKIVYCLQEIHGLGARSAFKFLSMERGPISDEVSEILQGQQLLGLWSDSKLDEHGQVGVGGLSSEEQGLLRTLVKRYIYFPKDQLGILTTEHYHLAHPEQLVPSSDRIVDSLRDKYKNIEDYERERKIFAEPLSNALKSISSSFEPVEPLSVGSSGLLIKIRDKHLTGAIRVLKFPRPRGGAFKVANLRIIQTERDRLCSLNHDRIVGVITAGETKYGDLQLPWYIMEYVGPTAENGSTPADLDDFLDRERSLDFGLLTSILVDIASALCYLHENNIVHCDIKSKNILVRPGSPPIAMITDLGYAHARTGDPKERISVRFSFPNAHPFLSKSIQGSSDPDAITTEIDRGQLHCNFDLHAFGKTIESLWHQAVRKLEKERLTPEEAFGKYRSEYLKLIIARLVSTGAYPSNADGPNEILSLEKYAPGLSTEVLVDELAYKDAAEAFDDLSKLSDRISLESMVPELNPFDPRVINLGAKETRAVLTDRVKRVLEHPAFNRLGNVSQLGILSYVYPGASHSRMEHSLGVYAQTCEYLRALWYNLNAPLFRSIMGKQDLCALLLASLLHDVGYYPLAHDLEDCEEWRNNGINHEVYSWKVINENLKELVSKDWGINPEYLKDLILGDQTTFRLKILHSIVNGPIDADKMDYLLRDGMHLGLPYADCIDKEWFLRNLTIAYGPNVGIPGIAVTDKGRVTAESLAFARYMMFSVAYWHHTVRAIKSMVKYALGRIAKGSKIDSHEHYAFFVNKSQEDHDGDQAMSKILELENVQKEISPSDIQQLLWIRDRLDDNGKAIIDMVLQRKLYKRLIVIDASRPETSPLFRDFEGVQDPQVKEMRDQLEKLIRKWVAENVSEEFSKMPEPLILIDVPRLQTLRELYYVSELGNTPLSQSSIVWKELADQFSKSVGKVRIFVHPDIKHVLKHKMKREKLLEMIQMVLASPVNYQRQ